MKNIKNYFESFKNSLEKIDHFKIYQIAKIINNIRKKEGRLFFLGVGGSAGNATHAVNDFRKICNVECYTPTDNVSELTANINDEGWENSLQLWLQNNNLNQIDNLQKEFPFQNVRFSKYCNSIENLITY